MKKLIIAILLCLTITDAWASNFEKIDKIPDNMKSVMVVIPIYSQKIAFRLPTSWKPAFQDKKPNFYIIEFTPKNENINSWQEMLTVQGFQNLAGRVTPHKFISDLAMRFKAVCGSDAIFESIGEKSIDGYQSYSAILGCAKVPNQNLSEIGYYIAIQGEKDLYLIQKANRKAALSSNKSFHGQANASSFMENFMPIELCKKGGAQGECNK